MTDTRTHSKALALISTVERALANGTKHFNREGKLLETSLEILKCLHDEQAVHFQSPDGVLICPHCTFIVGRGMSPPSDQTGSWCLCGSCGNVSVFTEPLSLRPATAEEKDAAYQVILSR